LDGGFADYREEWVCVGRSVDGERWAIAPDLSSDVLQLAYEKEFGLLGNLSGDPEKIRAT
jgi:hypothetical protein